MAFTSYSVDNDKIFAAAIARAKAVTQDLTIPLTSISKDWFRSNKAIFSLKSPGGYDDLGGFKPNEVPPYSKLTRRELAKKRKMAQVGFIYPLLVGKTQALKNSLTVPTSTDAVAEIVNKASLVLSTLVPYAIFHQSDEARNVLPLRKFFFIGPESKEFASNKELSGRAERWLNTMNDYVYKKLKQSGLAT